MKQNFSQHNNKENRLDFKAHSFTSQKLNLKRKNN